MTSTMKTLIMYKVYSNYQRLDYFRWNTILIVCDWAGPAFQCHAFSLLPLWMCDQPLCHCSDMQWQRRLCRDETGCFTFTRFEINCGLTRPALCVCVAPLFCTAPLTNVTVQQSGCVARINSILPSSSVNSGPSLTARIKTVLPYHAEAS